MDFFSIILTLASVGSIPLSYYLYIKSKENKVEKVKRDIVKILSYQIGDRRQLTTFEIQTVINSKNRESNIAQGKITIVQIIEDLVSETISNPLLEKDIKESIISVLKNIYFKNELLKSIDIIELQTRDDKIIHAQDENIEIEIKNIIEKRNDVKEEMESQSKIPIQTSDYFAVVAIIVTIISTGISLILESDLFKDLTNPLNKLLHDHYVILGFVVSALSTAFAFLATEIIKKTGNKKN